ncbi:MAG: CapA family protein, partial [Lachnospiraceae bacterium]|nr:CapA family protein [Lachnospiraceae bacterium]
MKRYFGLSSTLILVKLIAAVLLTGTVVFTAPGTFCHAAGIEAGDSSGTMEAGTSENGDTDASGIMNTGSSGKKDDEDSVTLVMIGDVLMHDKVIRSGLRANGSYNYDHLFENVRGKIEAADLAIVNQETILGGEELKITGYPSFNSPYELGDAEVKAGFDVVLHGTNHALDRFSKGVENCLDHWEKEHPEVEVLGIHDSAEDQRELCIKEINGIKLAILNYTYDTNGIQMPKEKPYLVDYLSEKKVRADIARAEKEADITIVCPHWGTEYSLEVSKEQEKWTEIFLESGVDLCIGTHPHVIEPVEVIRDDKGHEMTVYYSLGNFVNATSGTGKGVMNRMVGGMAEVTIRRLQNGEVKVTEHETEPVVCHLGEEKVSVYFLKDYTAGLADRNRIREQDPDFSL